MDTSSFGASSARDGADELARPSFYARELGAFESNEEALSVLRDRYSEREAQDPNFSIALAAWAAHYGDTDFALAALADSTRTRAQNVWFVWLPLFDETRRSPRFRQFVDDLGLTDYCREHGWPTFCEPRGDADFRCS